MMTDHVAIYGLGNMGFVQARRIAAEFPTKVFDLSEERLAAAASDFGATVITAPTDIRDCAFVVLCLPEPAASLAVLEEIGSHLRDDAIVMESSEGHIWQIPLDSVACANLDPAF